MRTGLSGWTLSSWVWSWIRPSCPQCQRAGFIYKKLLLFRVPGRVQGGLQAQLKTA